jgi:hypothetical protein
LTCEETCSVCLDAMTQGRRLACSHVFHEACLGRWFESHDTCPMCRRKCA